VQWPVDELAIFPIDLPLVQLDESLLGVSSQRPWNESQRRQAASTAPNQMAIPTPISPSRTGPSMTPSSDIGSSRVREAGDRWCDRMS
jgi:hypothetical protein